MAVPGRSPFHSHSAEQSRQHRAGRKGTVGHRDPLAWAGLQGKREGDKELHLLPQHCVAWEHSTCPAADFCLSSTGSYGASLRAATAHLREAS